ncbi:helix-turn-helix domain-containing protein [Pelosinus baikalensis]|uniref:Helix-turn-helix domain-containing protein n=1 Tax=Pelosinus baikalensis TaxID=2892015 RepID=A0ABS8HZ50_9FIRM|nr:helix-turn-helix transcriptional regulator [Pelosinus baikalensis]MCC5468237.1 helix-turn-helix domain-containing protein [Pelosinus baikalensis]
MSTLGQKIKQLRNSKGLTQKELAPLINTTRETLANWEVNRATPDIETIKSIADFFCVSVDYLLDRATLTPQTTELSQEDLALLEVARQLKNLPDTDRKEIESYIQYKEHSKKNNAQADATKK